jgi:A/G-specific adenine glycosylase
LLPRKVAKAKSPEFHCDMLLLRHGDLVLMQRRPEKAIWGGLWSLPESTWRAKEENSQAIANSLANLTVKALLQLVLPDEKISSALKHPQSIERGVEIKHIFTHRRLWIQIWHVTSRGSMKFTNDDLKWIPLRQLGNYGLPQPIKLLLQGLSLAHGDDLRS